ncbi:DUF6786 family protein [Flexithrix dorotheae]|uniref:DUF6786 family protein n=1 Tax=Flexithrix dorotheae TaxID=70993 RepID=UPI00036872B6|nr:DUF6786 family protein [Flexithrix dorotheae]
MISRIILFFTVIMSVACADVQQKDHNFAKGTFGHDVDFLSEFQEIVLLENENAKVLISPAYQGRIMTSTAKGMEGMSFGWMNYELISSGKIEKHINAFGGEDRFWMGPEGGQYSIFFKKDDPFDLDHWQTPTAIDSEPFKLISKTPTEAAFEKEIELMNYSGFPFKIKVDRKIILYSPQQLTEELGFSIPESINAVGFASLNSITNTGDQDWKKENGLLSIWILGMLQPSPENTIVIPVNSGEVANLGEIVNDTYFGKIPDDRIATNESHIFFKGDGKSRGKIGVSPLRATSFAGSYDAANNLLTIISYSFDPNANDYVNSMWEIQDEPYAGDVVNSYNDGPLDASGNQMGPFYELESSSPALELKKNESVKHVHQTFHFVGEEKELDRIANATLGVGIQEIQGVFSGN